MLATLGGTLALLCGLVVVLLPLLLPELSRPRDAFWGALVLLLGLVLVTSADRLGGAPMLAVLCGGLLIGRLGTEVGQARWRALSSDEQTQLSSAARWRRSATELGAALARLGGLGASAGAGVLGWWRQRRPAAARSGKRWVRPDPAASTAGDATPGQSGPEPLEPAPPTPEAAEGSEPVAPAEDIAPAAEVTSFEEIDILLGEVMAAADPRPAGAEEAEAATPAPARGEGDERADPAGQEQGSGKADG